MSYAQSYQQANRGAGTGAIFGAAAVGFAAGLAANMARKMAAQAPAAMHGDWLEALKTEHQIIDKMFDQILATHDKDVAKRTMLLKGLKGALQKHDLEEASVIYPFLRLHGSEAEARHLSEDHTDIKTYLLELDSMDKDDPSWLTRARAFQELVQGHVREEEEQIYPALRMRLSKEENDKLYRMTQLEAVKLA